MMEDPTFVPIFTLLQLPTSCIEDSNQELFYRRHYLGHFWKQSWDLFWLPPPPQCQHLGPLILATRSQAKDVLNSFDIPFPEGVMAKTTEDIEQILLRFSDWEGFLPTQLGKYDDKGKIKGRRSQLKSTTLARADREMREFCAKRQLNVLEEYDRDMERILEMDRRHREATHKMSSERTKLDLHTMKIMSQALTWFGLCRVCPPPFASRGFQRNFSGTLESSSRTDLQDPIFISIDCEWKDKEPYDLTEVGISILDSMDLVNLPPGKHGGNWKGKIQPLHLRVREHAGWVNRAGIRGCPRKFQWGQSRVIASRRIGAEVDRILNFPDRNLILVGQGVKIDIEKLREAGSISILNLGSREDLHLDVSQLFRILRRMHQEKSLGKALKDMGEKPMHLHNAGNDAYWTMHLLIRIIIEAASERKETSDNLLHPGRTG